MYRVRQKLQIRKTIFIRYRSSFQRKQQTLLYQLGDVWHGRRTVIMADFPRCYVFLPDAFQSVDPMAVINIYGRRLHASFIRLSSETWLTVRHQHIVGRYTCTVLFHFEQIPATKKGFYRNSCIEEHCRRSICFYCISSQRRYLHSLQHRFN